MPRFDDHDCHLPVVEDDVVNHFADTGFFISFRRKFRSWCMISRSHPDTRRYFKSHASCREEEVKHLVNHYYMIHPFSKLSMCWEFFMFGLFFFTYVLIAADASFVLLKKEDKLYLIKFIFDVIHVVDIIKMFFTGYYDEHRSVVVLKYHKTAKKYLITYFFLDIFSCLDSFIYLLGQTVSISYRVLVPLRIFNRLKIARLPRCLNALETFRQHMDFSSYLFNGIRAIFVFYVVSLWAFSINFFLTNYIALFIDSSKGTEHFSIFDHFYEATCMFLWVGYGSYKVTNVPEYLNAILFLSFGFMLQMFMYVQLFQVWIKYQSSENKHHSLYQQFEEYVKYQNLPMNTREKFFSYFDFKFHKNFFNESDINTMISPFMRQEILMHITRNHIEKVDFFRLFPEKVLTKIVGNLKSEVFLPGEVIVTAGKIGSSMFFIYHGTVAVYTPKGKEICHLEDGSHFGEIALVLSEARVATVIAVTHSELFVLRRSDFQRAVEYSPQIRKQLVALATERMHQAVTE